MSTSTDQRLLCEQATPGVINALLKRDVRQTCPGCGFPLPVYPGRYPKKCPNCDAPYDMPAPEEQSDKG